ncbi:MAG: 2-hydroxychromene-2-carboxylate isomerase [Pseudomonadota bacterium]
MKRRLDFYFEFASTYSYLSAMRIDALAEERGVEVHWRPVLLGPIFKRQGWGTSPFNLYPAKGAYMWRDLSRRAAKQGLPEITRPDPFPQNSLLAARIATQGTGEAWLPEFVRGLYHAQFAQGRSIGDRDLLVSLLNRLGLDSGALLDYAEHEPNVKDRLRKITEIAADRGLFGAPSFFTFDGELFWGDDRLEDALDWAVSIAR